MLYLLIHGTDWTYFPKVAIPYVCLILWLWHSSNWRKGVHVSFPRTQASWIVALVKDTLWLLRLGHKGNTASIWVSEDIGTSHHAVRKPKQLVERLCGDKLRLPALVLANLPANSQRELASMRASHLGGRNALNRYLLTIYYGINNVQDQGFTNYGP